MGCAQTGNKIKKEEERKGEEEGVRKEEDARREKVYNYELLQALEKLLHFSFLP